MATWVGLPRSYTPGRVRPVQYIVIHSTEGSEGPTAAENGAAYDKIRTDGTSTHLFIDSNSAVQEVRFTDRAHAARFHGNEIGIQIELCGLAGQTWTQWHDAASTAELRLAAKEVAAICKEYSIPVRRLSVAEVRAAYYNAAGARPKGICSHYDVTRAYPEDGGTHTDPGPNYPWAEFLAMVQAELSGGDMNLNDAVPSTFTPDNPDRNYNEVLGDVWDKTQRFLPQFAKQVTETLVKLNAKVDALQGTGVGGGLSEAQVREIVRSELQKLTLDLTE